MKKLNITELEIGTIISSHQGVMGTSPRAFVRIETSDDELLKQLISALSQVEDLEV